MFGPDGKPGFHLRGYNEQQNGLVKRRTAPADEMVGRESSGARSLEAKNAHEKTAIRADIGFWRFRFFISTLGRDALGAPDNPRLIVEFCGCPQLFLGANLFFAAWRLCVSLLLVLIDCSPPVFRRRECEAMSLDSPNRKREVANR